MKTLTIVLCAGILTGCAQMTEWDTRHRYDQMLYEIESKKRVAAMEQAMEEYKRTGKVETLEKAQPQGQKYLMPSAGYQVAPIAPRPVPRMIMPMGYGTIIY